MRFVPICRFAGSAGCEKCDNLVRAGFGPTHFPSGSCEFQRHSGAPWRFAFDQARPAEIVSRRLPATVWCAKSDPTGDRTPETGVAFAIVVRRNLSATRLCAHDDRLTRKIAAKTQIRTPVPYRSARSDLCATARSGSLSKIRVRKKVMRNSRGMKMRCTRLTSRLELGRGGVHGTSSS